MLVNCMLTAEICLSLSEPLADFQSKPKSSHEQEKKKEKAIEKTPKPNNTNH